MTPKIIDNVLDDVSWRALYAHVASQPMQYGAKSNSATDPHGHWSWKPLYDEQQNLADLTNYLPKELRSTWERIEPKVVGGRSQVIRSYANGYTYGTDGYTHVDSQRSDEHTIILYMVDQWHPDWAGETCFFKNGEIVAAVLPKPNRAVVAPSDMLHCARAVSRKCTTMRRTLMFKVRPRRSAGYEKLSQWLVLAGALLHKHQKGTLHDHLMRVYSLMQERPCPEVACIAGALHSIYGTNAFPKALIERRPEYRAHMAVLWGKDVENLVYLFSMIDRPKVLEQYTLKTVATLTTPAGERIDATALQQEYLCLIEAANLLDQGQLGKWPVLKAIWETN